jgi:hypothetical protein
LDARIPDGLTAIRQGWFLEDILHAHELLDQADAADARQRARVKS